MNPEKILCENCHKYQKQKPSENCDFCARLNFPEDVICHIARNGGEDRVLSECGAFRPLLSLVGKKKSVKYEEETSHDYFNSPDKEKWLNAIAKQRLQIEPDQAHFKIRFHICLVAAKRNKLFSSPNKYIEKISDIFHQIENFFEQTQIDALWLAEDHVHLRVDTTPYYSPDEIANKIISNSEQEILSGFPDLENKYEPIWERAHFTETMN